MVEKKEIISAIRRKLQERVRRSSEPFKGTIGVRKNIPTSTKEKESNTDETERENMVQHTSFEKKLREMIDKKKEPFCGCIGKSLR